MSKSCFILQAQKLSCGDLIFRIIVLKAKLNIQVSYS